MYPYNDSYEPVRQVPIVSGATKYDHPSGQSYILIINEALFYGRKMDHSLINPNQVRHGGVGFWDNPYDYNHKLGMEVYENDMNIPMEYQGTKLVFKTSVPTEQELNTLPHITLTSEQPWNPSEVRLGEVKSCADHQPSKIMIKATNIYAGNGCNGITRYEYQSNLDEDLMWLNEMNPVMLKLCELGSAHRDYNPKLNDIIGQGTFKSTKRHNDINEEILAES